MSSHSQILYILPLLIVMLVIALALWEVFLSSSGMRRRKLKSQAKADYKNARGTAHLRLMREAYGCLDRERRRCAEEIESTRRQLASLERDKQKELTRALELHIATNHLSEVPGIGSALQERILSTVFRGSLDDLHLAHQVHGVGQRRQWAISDWVRDYQGRLSDLLEEDFPGKDEILASHEDSIDETQARVHHLATQNRHLKHKLDRLRPEIDRLEAVSEKDLAEALQGSTDGSDKLDLYLRGVFAEWEPIPDWFKDIVLTEVE